MLLIIIIMTHHALPWQLTADIQEHFNHSIVSPVSNCMIHTHPFTIEMILVSRNIHTLHTHTQVGGIINKGKTWRVGGSLFAESVNDAHTEKCIIISYYFGLNYLQSDSANCPLSGAVRKHNMIPFLSNILGEQLGTDKWLKDRSRNFRFTFKMQTMFSRNLKTYQQRIQTPAMM